MPQPSRTRSRATAPPSQRARPRDAALAVTSPATESTADLCEIRCINQERVDRAREAMPADRTLVYAAEMLRVLGDPTRLRIARALATEELCVCDIATLLGLSQPTVSHSLRALRQLRLVRYRKFGKIAYYALDDAHILQLLDSGLAHAAEAEPAR